MQAKLTIDNLSLNLSYESIKSLIGSFWGIEDDQTEIKQLCKILLNHPSFEVLEDLAGLDFIDEEDFVKLINTGHSEVISNLLGNNNACSKYLTEEHINQLKNQPSLLKKLAYCVGQNSSNFGDETIAFFASHPAPEVRVELIDDGLPKKVLMTLIKDSDQAVSKKAKQTYKYKYD